MAVSRVGTEHVEALVRQHQETVRGFLLFLGCPSRLVDDLVQEVFLSVLASPFEDRGAAQTAAYLRKVARHLLVRALRRESREPPVLELDDAEATWARFEGDDGGRSYLDALRECVQRLVGTAAEVVRLRYHAALALADIGKQLGLSDAGVKSVLLRTRARLRECVERRLA
jgi:RNA polymerase sigma-70 factor (ECF subfamily)